MEGPAVWQVRELCRNKRCAKPTEPYNCHQIPRAYTRWEKAVTVDSVQDSHLGLCVIPKASHKAVRTGVLRVVELILSWRHTCLYGLTWSEIPKPLIAYAMTNAGNGGAGAMMVYAMICAIEPTSQIKSFSEGNGRKADLITR